MANPKRRTSKSRRDKRRSHDSISIKPAAECSNCGGLRRPHRVCGSCGWYDGKQAIPLSED